MIYSVITSLLSQLNIDHELNAPLGPLTWYGMGGNAQALAHPADAEQLSALLSRCHAEQVPVHVFGSGANLLVRDQGVKGIVIRLDRPGFKQMAIAEHTVTVGAGYDLAKLVLETAKAGLGGLEILAGIPASVGGAIRMNAGGRFGEIGPVVSRIKVMDLKGEAYERCREDLYFSYRQTNIRAPIILEAELELVEDDPESLMKQVKEIFLYKKNTQPLGEDSAGCAFKNPQPTEEDDNPYLRQSAGQLIDKVGLKGHQIGDAIISDRHANFIVAGKQATATDILNLLEHVEKVVLEQLDVPLQREVVVW